MKLVVIEADALAELVKGAVREALETTAFHAEDAPAKPASSLPEWLSVNAGCKAFGMGRRQWLDSIKQGRLPATVRTMRGGREGFMVRAADAERVLGTPYLPF